ncbi:hypothetical protein LN042_23935 [Kitasatospora sp. RB6PN24]|uniref:hypothetical protein n=1 Tax=Kitasatospora humi TaxID=2893891 RepID=UPI001E39112E|nr:hypothetical protein [Kitasatospora humi]MCC9310081.1 hypothetical protein [Kitasatospora humi]
MTKTQRTYTVWIGSTSRDEYRPDYLATLNQAADAAHHGDWPTILSLLPQPGQAGAQISATTLANTRRVGDASGSAPLHHAARLAAPPAVIEQLIAAGAWRTLRDARGERPVDIATRLGHHHLAALLRPAPKHPVPDVVLQAMEPQLHTLLRARAQQLAGHQDLLLPQVAVLTELPDPLLTVTVPGMYGNFIIELQNAQDPQSMRLEVSGSSRVAGGSGQTHHITAADCTLVEDGWG